MQNRRRKSHKAQLSQLRQLRPQVRGVRAAAGFRRRRQPEREKQSRHRRQGPAQVRVPGTAADQQQRSQAGSEENQLWAGDSAAEAGGPGVAAVAERPFRRRRLRRAGLSPVDGRRPESVQLRAGAPAAAVPPAAAGAAAGPAVAADQRAAVCERERRVPVFAGQRADLEPLGRQLHPQTLLRQDDLSAGRAAVGAVAGADAAVRQPRAGQVVLHVAELDPSVREQRQERVLQEGHPAHQQHDGVPDQVRADKGRGAAAAERGRRRGRAAERRQHRDEPEERDRRPQAGQFLRDPAAAVRAPAVCDSGERPVCSVADLPQAVQHDCAGPAVQVCAEPDRPVADADLHSVVVRHDLGAGVARLPRAVLQPRVVRHEARRGLDRAHERVSRRDLPGVCRHLPPAPPHAQPHHLERRGGRRARRAEAAAGQLPRLRAAGAGGLVCVRGAAEVGAVLGDLGADQAARDVRARRAHAGRDREPDARIHPHVRDARHGVADRDADGVARVQHRAALQERELAAQAAAVCADAVQDRQHGHDQDGDAADRRGVRDGVQGGGDTAGEGVAGVGHRLSAVLALGRISTY
ncbi:hypothetical protein KL912_002042 [Ogataea haglerorum]|nr:hypothetical protein KL912_002042 [Ogataea haglerorum]